MEKEKIGKNKKSYRKKIQIPEKRPGRGSKIFLVFLLIAMIAIIFVILSILLEPGKLTFGQEPKVEYYYPKFFSLEDSVYVSMYLPAVDQNGEGIITTLGIESVKGSGRVLIDIENLLFWDDTQESIRTSKFVAGKITGKKMNNYDFVYNIHTNASLVGGPSAGAAITIATIAAVEEKKINENVMITGTVEEDGTVGQVTGIRAKAEAAKQINITTFLVPPGQSKETYYVIKKECKKIGKFDYCTVKQIPKQRDISELVDINIIEVSTIEEAIEYFF